MERERLNVLVVDDDPDDVELLTDVLEEMRAYEVEVTPATSYEQALRLDLDRFDLVFLDFQLGAHSGIDLLRRFAEFQVAAPVILLTGLDDPAIDDQALRGGAADFLVKGEFDSPALERSIRYSLAWGRLVCELRARDGNQRRLIDAVFDGLIVHEFDGVILRVNETAAALLGEPSEALVGTSLGRWLPVSEVRDAARAESRHVPTERELVRADGTRASIEWQCRPLWHDGRDAVLTCLRDVGLRKRMQSELLQRERLATAGLLASSLAHEIGTPLAVMRGRAEMLQLVLAGVETPPSVARNTAVIVEQIDRITRLIRGLLNFMRGEASVEIQDVSLRDALDDALELVSGELRGKGVIADVSGVQDVFVRAEADGLRQVLVNLLVNAVHAIEAKAKGGSPVAERRVSLSTRERTPGTCEISVADTGCGIPRANIESIFVPFFTTKCSDEGTGLGLAIVQRSLTAWGGGVEVESVEGQGTVFHLRIPMAAPRD